MEKMLGFHNPTAVGHFTLLYCRKTEFYTSHLLKQGLPYDCQRNKQYTNAMFILSQMLFSITLINKILKQKSCFKGEYLFITLYPVCVSVPMPTVSVFLFHVLLPLPENGKTLVFIFILIAKTSKISCIDNITKIYFNFISFEIIVSYIIPKYFMNKLIWV